MGCDATHSLQGKLHAGVNLISVELRETAKFELSYEVSIEAEYDEE